MKNYVQKGDVLTFTAAADLSSGAVVKIGSLIGIVCADVKSGAQGEANLCGIYSGLAKAAGAAWAQGDMLYWDATNSVFTKTASSNTFAGYAAAAAQTADTSGSVLLAH